MLKVPPPVSALTRRLRRQDGQTMAEYGVTLGVITIGIVTALAFLSAAVEAKLGSAIKIISGAV